MNCDDGTEMAQEKRDVRLAHKGRTCTVSGIFGWHCPKCGEVEFLDQDGSERFQAALEALSAEAAKEDAARLARIRKRLGLTQKQAATLTGGGVNAFSRYERGEARPLPAVINLFRLLDKHPELLDEIR